MRKTSLFLLVMVLILSALTGCAQTAPETAEDASAPQEAATEAPAEQPTEEPAEELKFVSTVPSVTEILFALGCGDNIVGVDSMSTYPAEALEIEKVGDYNGIDVEMVISLEPDVVFAGNKLQEDQINTLKDLGINVIATEPTAFENITASITEIGAVVGKEAEAKAIVENINAVVEAVKNNENIPDDKPTIYYVMGIGEYGNWTSGEGSFINTAMEIAGAVCVTAGSEAEWMDYPLEDLILADPDILIVSQWVMEADLLADETYMELTAVKEGNYFFVNPDIIERPGPRITEALEFLQQCIIGE